MIVLSMLVLLPTLAVPKLAERRCRQRQQVEKVRALLQAKLPVGVVTGFLSI